MGRSPLPRRLKLSSCVTTSTCGISGAFAPLSPTAGQVATCSSAVRHARPEGRAFDLHALGTPPAFVLSQDQTLHGCGPRRRDARGPTKWTPNTKRASSRFSCEGTAAVGAIKNQGHARVASTWRTASVTADPERPYLLITGSTRQASETTKMTPSRSIAHPLPPSTLSSRVACYSSQRGLLYHAVNDLSSGIKGVLKSLLQANHMR